MYLSIQTVDISWFFCWFQRYFYEFNRTSKVISRILRGCQLRCLRAFAITWYHTFFLKNWNNSIKMQKKKPNQKEKKQHWERSWNRSREKDNWVGLRSVVSVWETCLGFRRWFSAHPQITIPGARSYGISHTLPHTKLSISGKTNLWRYQCFLWHMNALIRIHETPSLPLNLKVLERF